MAILKICTCNISHRCPVACLKYVSVALQINFTFMGSFIVRISNKMQRYTVYLYLETALHVLGGTTTHHQEHIQLYLQH